MADGPRSSRAQLARRGAFILLEGVDRCGKTTQANLLVEGLKEAGHDTHFMRFPGEKQLKYVWSLSRCCSVRVLYARAFEIPSVRMYGLATLGSRRYMMYRGSF